MSMPRIASACVRASAGVLATLMPPAFPRPPTWTCAFTTQGPDPIARAAASTSAGVVATRPSGMAIPARARTCFAWNSWSFTGEAEDSPSAMDASREARVPFAERRCRRARAHGRLMSRTASSPHVDVQCAPDAARFGGGIGVGRGQDLFCPRPRASHRPAIHRARRDPLAAGQLGDARSRGLPGPGRRSDAWRSLGRGRQLLRLARPRVGPRGHRDLARPSAGADALADHPPHRRPLRPRGGPVGRQPRDALERVRRKGRAHPVLHPHVPRPPPALRARARVTAARAPARAPLPLEYGGRALATEHPCALKVHPSQVDERFYGSIARASTATPSRTTMTLPPTP